MHLPNLHTTPKGDLTKIKKTNPIQKNISSHDVLKGLNAIKFEQQ